MFAPKTISSASQCRKSPIAARASSIMRSVLWLVLIRAVGVGIVARQIVGDGVDHPLRNLRATGSIHEDSRMSVNRLR